MDEIKRVFSYINPYKWNIAKAVICNILYAFFSLFTLAMIVPFISVIFGLIEPIYVKPNLTIDTQSWIDTLSYYITMIENSHGIYWALLFVSCLFLACSLLSNLFKYLYYFFITPINANTIKDIRNELYNKILVLPLSYYTKHQSGDIITRINADIQEVDTLVRRTVELVLQQPFVILVFLCTLMIISPTLTIMSLILVPTVGYAASKITKKIRLKAKKGQEELSKLSADYEESISGIRVIKSFNAEDFFNQKFQSHNHEFATTTKKMLRYTELAAPLSEILTIFAMLVVIFVGSIFIFNNNNHFTSESLILFVLVFARLIPPIQSSIRAYSYIQKGIISAKRIFEVMDSDEKIIEKPHALPIKDFSDKIVFQNVLFHYEQQTVLQDFNLDIHKGEKIALVGASGSGKTTIVNLLLRLYDIEDGSLTIDGKPIQDYIISDVRALFGLVSQDVILFNDTISNNICFSKTSFSEQDIITAAKIADAHNFITSMPQQYQTIIGDRGMNLSGGQRQKISIARAILNNPPILVFDEATSSLDSQSEISVQKAIEKITKDKTTIIIAHKLKTVQDADRILVLSKGKIMEEGNHQTLMALKGLYYSMVSGQELK
jgi:subfamily B ATP-binding cassette protein MsbA